MNLQFIKMSAGSAVLRDLGKTVIRTVIMLILTGAYLQYMLQINSMTADIAWIVLITACTSAYSLRQARTGRPRLLLPLFAGMLAGLAVAILLFMAMAGLTHRLSDARCIIPSTGLILSAMLTSCTAGTATYCRSLAADSKQYNFLMGNSATHAEAAAPFIRKAMEEGMRRIAGETTIIQLAFMPAMYGMILGGLSPMTAMKYQLFLLLASLTASATSIILTIYLADKMLFDNFGRIRHIKAAAALIMLASAMTACTAGNNGKPLMGGDITDRTETGSRAIAGGQAHTDTMPQMELPAYEDSAIILRRTGYTACYDPEHRIPRWVAWYLTAGHTTGNHSRKNQNFTEDEDVPEPRATHYDYMRAGYDRGHMCPSGDCKWSESAQAESFLLTNICPQNPNLNRGDWNEMENQCRTWAEKYGEIYIVCGPVLLKGRHKTIGTNKITVPEAFFKVVLRTSPDTCAIGFIYRNTDGDRPKDSYMNTVDQVERITGLDFFPNLPDETENRVEAKADIDEW